MKPNKYLLFLLTTIVAYGLFEYYRPKPIDWNPTYTNKDKIPFGTRVLFDLLPDIMNRQPVTSLRLPVYNHLSDKKLPARSNYIFVCHTLKLTGFDRTKLLDYVSRGNTVFISAYEFPDSLARQLGFRADLKTPTLRDTTLGMNFTNPTLKNRLDYHFRHDDGRNFLVTTKATQMTVLGRNARNEPIFLKIRYGKGTFYIHNLPLAFTNFYVLDPATDDYAYKALSYLPALPTYWDEYQKLGRFDEDEQSLLRYILTQPPLVWAYYLTVAGLVLYVIFAGKRTQRVIPVVEPLKNTSLAFVQNIGRLYFQRADHGNLAKKKIQYFLAYVREQFGLNTTLPDEEFKQALARKSGVSEQVVHDLFRQIAFSQQQIMSEYDLIRLNELIEKFYVQAKA
ncbi:hypothetical protein GCM10028803_13930 [Larkinella knui]|uniref:DUF4350 domain-containing protein n=1 Tax=Larkinella knui TaxID=2025310 RepID=A0A3P1CBG6_9BACT|nr:DUF4350 domain-containing protein [Larkinella knui]RRB10661.1 DUF4350 domain-containing protein [Larkinella knui]